MPAAEPRDVFETGTGRPRRAQDAAGVRLVGREGDRIIYHVGSGNYKFRVHTQGH